MNTAGEVVPRTGVSAHSGSVRNKYARCALYRASIFWIFFFAANAFAQDDMIVTNLADLVRGAFSGEHSIYLPWSPWQWQGYSFDGGQPWWVDCSQLPCTELLQPTTNLQYYGVSLSAVVLTKNVLTGETTVQLDGSTDVVARIAAPNNYQPGALSEDRGVWSYWQQATNCPDCWGIEGEIPPPIVTLKVLLADITNYATCQSNIEAEAEAQAEAEATASSEPRFTAMAVDERGGMMLMDNISCTITDEASPFAILGIAHDTNGWTTITWQSCNDHVYGVLSADELMTNTIWTGRVGMWGENGSTTWTDIATTNVDHRFYKVVRMPANGDFDGDGMPNGWEANHGLNPLDASDAAGDPDGDGRTNLQEYQQGTDPQIPDTSNSHGTLQIVGGWVHSLLLQDDGTVLGFGAAYDGELGNGAGPNPTNIPVRVNGISNAVSIAVGSWYSAAARADGTAWTWGYGGRGQLGNGTWSSTNTPVQVPGLSNVIAVAAGDFHTLALTSDGTVWGWGNNSAGQLGNGTTTNTNLPVQVIGLTNVTAIAAPVVGYFSLALTADGSVWAWGANWSGDLGNGGTMNSSTPIQVPGMTSVTAIAAGGDHAFALKANGTLWGWGGNYTGELGVGTTNEEEHIPVQVVGLTNVIKIASGEEHSVAITADGSMWAWGDNYFGELGYADDTGDFMTNVPVRVPNITSAIGLGTGDAWTFAVVSQPCFTTVRGWGWNTYGQVGTGPVFPWTSAGYLHRVVRTPETFLDRDGDGLPDWVECALGTDPTVADTDHNGVTDGYEDSDGDGLTNLQELQLSTDPADPDTDHNGVNDGDEDFDADGLTNRQEFQLGLSPFVWSTAGDGLPDGWKIKYGLDPYTAYDKDADPDNDGLTNLQEANYGTNPFEADTDGDGYTDYEEVMGFSYSSESASALTDSQPSSTVEYLSVSTADGSVTNLAFTSPNYASEASSMADSGGGSSGVSDPLDPNSTPTTEQRVAVKAGIRDPDFNDDTWSIFMNGKLVVSNRGNFRTVAYNNVFLEPGQTYTFTIQWVSDDGTGAGDEYALSFDNAKTPSAGIPWLAGSGNWSLSGSTGPRPDVSNRKWTYTVIGVKITATDPDISVLCAGCTMQFYAETQPPNREVVWSIQSDETGAASISSDGLLSVSTNAVKGNVLVRVADKQVPQAYDERSIFVFVSPADKPLVKINGAYHSHDEISFGIFNPRIGSKLMDIASQAKARTVALFPDPNDSQDGAIGNAFQHAYGSCLAAQKFGVDVAKAAGDAHEEYTGNPCNEASMDFYNNAVGRSLACPSCDCEQAVLDAINQGKLRWQHTLPTPPPCPQFDSESGD